MKLKYIGRHSPIFLYKVQNSDGTFGAPINSGDVFTTDDAYGSELIEKYNTKSTKKFLVADGATETQNSNDRQGVKIDRSNSIDSKVEAALEGVRSAKG